MKLTAFNILIFKRNIALLLCSMVGVLHLQAGDYYKTDKMMFDFYSPNWVNTPNQISSDYNKSFGFAFTWGADRQIKKSLFSYYYGLSYDYNKIGTNAKVVEPINLLGHPADLHWEHYTIQPKINKFKLHYIDVPLELRFRTQTRIPFRFYLGAKVGYLIKSSYVHESTLGNTINKSKLDGLNPLKYGLTCRIGYGLFNVYTYYGLNSTLTKEVGGGTHQFSIGLSLLAN